MTTNRMAARPTQATTHRRWQWRLGGAGIAACVGLTALIAKQAEKALPAAAQGPGAGDSAVAVTLSDTAVFDPATGQTVDFVCTKPTCVIAFTDPNGQIAPVTPSGQPAAASATVAGQRAAAPVVRTRTGASR